MHLTLRDSFNMNNKKLRKQGLIPGIVYGKNFEPVQVVANKKELQEIYKTNKENKIFDVTFENEKHTVYIQEVQNHSIDKEIIHFDLHKVNKEDVIHTHIPVVLVNKDKLERQGLIVQQQLMDVEVKYNAYTQPAEIDIDISELGHGEHLRVADLQAPSGVDILGDYNTIVASVNYPKTYIETPDE
ncbi:50S ribosomal protein L25 [Alkalithermobacter paradoxus]|uniref:Large ribosomal subunit protein bL25 n=1 Tax=Alkalithermobacter paradoxus TaxID=29349 RepID=A0A1V4I410_9FIRM|nr:general stress protein CTC [[Clostridium] thermoalcaliphilum]